MANHVVSGQLVPDAVSGHLALELANTRAGWGGASPREYLVSYDALAVWAGDVGPAVRVRDPAACAALGREHRGRPRQRSWPRRSPCASPGTPWPRPAQRGVATARGATSTSWAALLRERPPSRDWCVHDDGRVLPDGGSVPVLGRCGCPSTARPLAAAEMLAAGDDRSRRRAARATAAAGCSSTRRTAGTGASWRSAATGRRPGRSPSGSARRRGYPDRVTHEFETLAIHAGQEPDPTTGAVVPPIYQTSTYAQDGVGGLRNGYEYSRSGNPTRDALQECLAALEDPVGAAAGTTRGMAFASGLAAEDTLLRTVGAPGDHVVIPDDAYGGTYRLFAKVLAALGPRPHACAAHRRRRRRRRGHARAHVGRVGRDADQPAAARRRHRGARRRRARRRRAPRRRQHLRLAVPPAAAAARRRRRRALDDEVPRRPQRRRRRRARRARPRARRAAGLPPERDGRGGRAVRLVARAARRQDPRRPHGPALRQRPRRRRRAASTTRRWPRCSTPGSRGTTATTSRSSRCATSAAWSASASPAARARRSRSATARGSSPSASRSAASSRSSSTPAA